MKQIYKHDRPTVRMSEGRPADLSDFQVAQLTGVQPVQSPVQLEQLQGMAAQPLANQESREAGRQEEQRADVSLRRPWRRTRRRVLVEIRFKQCFTKFTDHLSHVHRHVQGGPREQTPDGQDFTHFRVFSTLHLKIHRSVSYINS